MSKHVDKLKPLNLFCWLEEEANKSDKWVNDWPPPSLSDKILYLYNDSSPSKKKQIRFAIDSICSDPCSIAANIDTVLEVWIDCKKPWIKPNLQMKTLLLEIMGKKKTVKGPIIEFALMRGPSDIEELFEIYRTKSESPNLLRELIRKSSDDEIYGLITLSFVAAALVINPKSFFLVSEAIGIGLQELRINNQNYFDYFCAKVKDYMKMRQLGIGDSS